MYCIHCTTVPIYRTHVTTNFRRHLLAKHAIEVSPETSSLKLEIKDQFAQLQAKAQQNGGTTEIGEEVFKCYLDQDIINEALVSLIIVRNLLSRIVEQPEFHTLCLAFNPQADGKLTTAYSTIPKLIEATFQISKDIVRKKLQSALSRIHLSLDIWTSPNHHLFLGIVAHFIDNGEKKQQALLALRTVPNHTGEEQANVLFQVLQDFGIVERLGVIMGDNASNNDTLCRAILARLKENGVKWNSVQERLRYLGHIINLII